VDANTLQRHPPELQSSGQLRPHTSYFVPNLPLPTPFHTLVVTTCPLIMTTPNPYLSQGDSVDGHAKAGAIIDTIRHDVENLFSIFTENAELTYKTIGELSRAHGEEGMTVGLERFEEISKAMEKAEREQAVQFLRTLDNIQRRLGSWKEEIPNMFQRQAPRLSPKPSLTPSESSNWSATTLSSAQQFATSRPRDKEQVPQSAASAASVKPAHVYTSRDQLRTSQERTTARREESPIQQQEARQGPIGHSIAVKPASRPSSSASTSHMSVRSGFSSTSTKFEMVDPNTLVDSKSETPRNVSKKSSQESQTAKRFSASSAQAAIASPASLNSKGNNFSPRFASSVTIEDGSGKDTKWTAPLSDSRENETRGAFVPPVHGNAGAKVQGYVGTAQTPKVASAKVDWSAADVQPAFGHQDSAHAHSSRSSARARPSGDGVGVSTAHFSQRPVHNQDAQAWESWGRK
jgi:hypothetical protein